MSPADVDDRRVVLRRASIVTADLDRARRFWEDVVGLRAVLVEHHRDAAFRRVALLAQADGAMALELLEIPGYDSGLADDVVGRRGRLDHLGFLVAATAFDAVVARLVDAGASSGVASAAGGVRTVVFVDPDGGHHHLLTADPGWSPPPSTDVFDRDLLRRLLGAATHLPDRPPAQRGTP